MTTHRGPALPAADRTPSPNPSPDPPDPTPFRPADRPARPTDVCRFPYGKPAGAGGRADS